jgi:hypothetical protein
VHVYLFGEKHDTPSSDPVHTRIDVYLDNLLKTSEKRIDVFIESAAYSTPISITDKASGLYYLRQLFLPCIVERSRCPYKNARIHFNDLRPSSSDAHNMYRNHFLEILDAQLPYPAWLQNLRQQTNLGDTREPEHIAEFVMNNIMKWVPRIAKNVHQSHVKHILIQFIKDKFLAAIQAQKVGDIRMLVVDMYSLARMFKGDDTKNIVLYAGAAHTKIHAEFLYEIGFEIIESIRNSGHMWLSLDRIRQPLFQ